MRRGLHGCAVDEEAAGHALDFGRGDEPGRRVGSDIRAGVVSGTAKARRPPSAGLGAGWRQLTRRKACPTSAPSPGTSRLRPVPAMMPGCAPLTALPVPARRRARAETNTAFMLLVRP